MAFLYLDDSKHHPRGFSLATFVIFENDPQAELVSIVVDSGYDPSKFEFKSSFPMANNAQLRELRANLRWFMFSNCKIAVCVVSDDSSLGPASLALLHKSLGHHSLAKGEHEVFFDQGLFPSVVAAEKLAFNYANLDKCKLHFEQDSKSVLGLQVSDLAAHTCGTMLSDALGFITKRVPIDHPGYPDLSDIELGFLLWTGVRYNFLSEMKTNNPDNNEFFELDVEKYGLLIHESASEKVAKAAQDRFGTMYVGCIH